jgi:hypothetical protein
VRGKEKLKTLKINKQIKRENGREGEFLNKKYKE